MNRNKGDDGMRNLFVCIAALSFFSIPSISYSLNVGDRAPLFNAESTRSTISLESYLGQKNVILAFYFADFTPV
jgi:peroxiredoxin Q/BCP